MTDLAQFSALAALIIGGFGLFAWMFQRLETRSTAGSTSRTGALIGSSKRLKTCAGISARSSAYNEPRFQLRCRQSPTPSTPRGGSETQAPAQ